MKKIVYFRNIILIIFMIILIIIFYNKNLLSQIQNDKTLNTNATKNLESRGLNKIRQVQLLRLPQFIDSTQIKDSPGNLIKISAHVKIPKSNYKSIQPPLNKETSEMRYATYDTLLFEGFEDGIIDTTIWQLSGNPTWGATNFLKQSGSSSAWCAAGGDSARNPAIDNYPNNCNAWMTFGPFDLNNATLAFLKFSLFSKTEMEHDWLFWGASKDGENFSLIGISGNTNGWKDEALNLGNIPDIGDLTGRDEVWITFGFVSDSSGTNKGVFIDDVELFKGSGFEVLGGWYNGTIIKENSPYIALWNVGVRGSDSLVIEPGVEIRFAGPYEFISIGELKAEGTEDDSITFTSNNENPAPGDWVGIGIYNNELSYTLSHCIIEYAGILKERGQQRGAGIFSFSDSTIIQNCRISNNLNSGILNESAYSVSNCIIELNDIGVFDESGYSPSEIDNNIIRNNQGSGISCSFSNPDIKNNIIIKNGAGIGCGYSDPLIINNLIANNSTGINFLSNPYVVLTGPPKIIKNTIINNTGDAIKLAVWYNVAIISNNVIAKNEGYGVHAGNWDTEPPGPIVLFNNTIVSNNYGIYFNQNMKGSVFKNNIIAYNKNTGISIPETDIFNVYYNDLYSNNPNFEISVLNTFGIIDTVNINGYDCDEFFNIYSDPMFVDTAANDYKLEYNSNCINAGDPNPIFKDQDGTVNDIGAFGGSYITINPTEYNFGYLSNGNKKSIDITILNLRDSLVIFDSYSITDSLNFSIKTSFPITVNPYGYNTISLECNPKELGELKSTLIIFNTNLTHSDTAFIELFGNSFEGHVLQGEIKDLLLSFENSPYLAEDDISVENGDSLQIEPGVTIYFSSDSKFQIMGYLHAEGTREDSIIFTTSSLNSRWNGIEFLSEADSSSLLKYCIIEYSKKSGLNCGSNITVEKCLIKKNKGNFAAGISISGSSPIITGCKIFDNFGKENECGAIYIRNASPKLLKNKIESNGATGIYSYKSNCIIKGNEIINNSSKQDGGGIYTIYGENMICNNTITGNNAGYGGGICLGHRSAFILISDQVFNNLIANNNAGQGGGMYIRRFPDRNKAKIVNNTICYNYAWKGGGIKIDSYNPAYRPTLKNNIIFSNIASLDSQISYIEFRPPIEMSYTNIQGGYNGEGNINVDPLFVDPEKLDFNLQPNSPCIDVGCDSSQYNDPENMDKPGFALYPALGTTRNDMGAYGGPGAANWPVNQAPNSFSLLTPINGDTIQTLTPTFEWETSIDPDFGDLVHYNFYLDESQNFSSPIIVLDLTTTNHSSPDTLKLASTYYWKVIAYDNDSLTTLCNEVFSFTTSSINNISQVENNLPKFFNLSQNYPNPFNPKTTIKYQLSNDCHVVLKIYNMLGKEVITLIDKDQNPGYYEIQWDAFRNASGLYFYYLKAESKSNNIQNKIYKNVKKMLLLK